jgi:hypothetical protein
VTVSRSSVVVVLKAVGARFGYASIAMSTRTCGRTTTRQPQLVAGLIPGE